MSRRNAAPGSSSPEVTRVPASWRVALAAPVGVAAGLGVLVAVPWQAAVLIGWDVAAAVYIADIFLAVWRLDAAQTRQVAVRVDPNVATRDVAVVTAGVACLAAVGLALLRAGNAHGGTKAYLIAVGMVSVAMAWGAVHTIFMLRYARVYYSPPVGGIDFNEPVDPTYVDFAYLALTVGMTFQVSDTNLTTRAIRRTALHHALLSYVFGAVIVALLINVVSSLLH